jgi:hypothetical protein
MLVSGDQWPVFLYAGYTYDAEDPWNGLCRSPLLVSVRDPLHLICYNLLDTEFSDVLGVQACIHITQFSRKGAQSYPLWQCSHSWDDARDGSVNCLYCYPGTLSSLTK